MAVRMIKIVQNRYPMFWNAVSMASSRMTVAMNWPIMLKDMPKERMTCFISREYTYSATGHEKRFTVGNLRRDQVHRRIETGRVKHEVLEDEINAEADPD